MNNLGFTFVSMAEARKIKKRINKGFDHFLDFSPLNKKTVSALKNCDPSLEGALRYSQLDAKGRILRLKTKKDSRCIFLNDKGKCDIYTLRPKVCKIYPFWAMRLINGKIKVIEHDPEPRCPVIAKAKVGQLDIERKLFKKQVLAIKKIFYKIEKESAAYKKAKK